MNSSFQRPNITKEYILTRIVWRSPKTKSLNKETVVSTLRYINRLQGQRQSDFQTYYIIIFQFSIRALC